jgi:hypothetical protein
VFIPCYNLGVYFHTLPDTITLRINLAADSLRRDKFTLKIQKPNPDPAALPPRASYTE